MYNYLYIYIYIYISIIYGTYRSVGSNLAFYGLGGRRHQPLYDSRWSTPSSAVKLIEFVVGVLHCLLGPHAGAHTYDL